MATPQEMYWALPPVTRTWLTAAVKRCAASGSSRRSAVARRTPAMGAEMRQERPAESTSCEAIGAAGRSNGAFMPAVRPESGLAAITRPVELTARAAPGQPLMQLQLGGGQLRAVEPAEALDQRLVRRGREVAQ